MTDFKDLDTDTMIRAMQLKLKTGDSFEQTVELVKQDKERKKNAVKIVGLILAVFDWTLAFTRLVGLFLVVGFIVLAACGVMNWVPAIVMSAVWFVAFLLAPSDK